MSNKNMQPNLCFGFYAWYVYHIHHALNIGWQNWTLIKKKIVKLISGQGILIYMYNIPNAKQFTGTLVHLVGLVHFDLNI